ncbi:MAG TPA: DUF4142 domain-containing protein [Anaeromyxobacter sp.]|nr:DUF4142 domain-containing protein [Anaeromyxobacter sp.]
MFTKRAVVAALAASLAVPPAALAKERKSVVDEARRRAEESARSREQARRAEGQAQPQAPEKGTPSPLSDAQRTAVGDVVARLQLEQSAAGMGVQKGRSAEVKNLARWLADDHRRVSEDLGKLLRDRGADPATLPAIADREKLQGELAVLSNAPPDDFDRAFVDFLTRNSPALKDAFGRARDATPGSDAELKWYLDQGERLAIGHRDAARQLASQRQARTPAPTPAPGRPPGR